MAKQPEQRDHFKLVVDNIEPAQLGEIVAALAKIGPNLDVRPELVTSVINYKTRNTPEVTASSFIDEWSKQHPTFQQRDLLKAMKEDGRTPGAVYYGIRMLIEKGVLKKLDDNGNYTRADVKHIEAPKKEKTKPKPKITRDNFDVDHREFILRYARQHNGRFNLAKLRAHFEAHKRKPTSVGGAIHVLQQRKLIKPLGEGEFVLLSKGGAKPAEKKAAPKPTAAPKPNGVGAHVEPQPEAVING